MATLTEGSVTINIPDDITIPAQAGTLNEAQIRAIPKPRRGLGLVTDQTASEMEKSGFVVPGVAPAELRRQGAMAEGIDDVIRDVEILLAKLRQANTLIDADAYKLLRITNDQVRSAAKHDASVKERFSSLIRYFQRSRRGSGGGPEEPTGETTPT
jgi:hypothetical protein